MDETIEVPFLTVGNRQILTSEQLVEMPWLKNFVDRFPACFEYDHRRNYWALCPDGRFAEAANCTTRLSKNADS